MPFSRKLGIQQQLQQQSKPHLPQPPVVVVVPLQDRIRIPDPVKAEDEVVVGDDARRHGDDEEPERPDVRGGNGGTTRERSPSAVSVETFLDEHAEFLEDYVHRKVSKSKLETWLFRPSSVGAVVGGTTKSGGRVDLLPKGGDSPDLQRRRDEEVPVEAARQRRFCFPPKPPGAVCSSSGSQTKSFWAWGAKGHGVGGGGGGPLVKHSGSKSFSGGDSSQDQRQQRSRSFFYTPLRRLSAARFEEGGLSTPILATGQDGQVSFLRTAPKQAEDSGPEPPDLGVQRQHLQHLHRLHRHHRHRHCRSESFGDIDDPQLPAASSCDPAGHLGSLPTDSADDNDLGQGFGDNLMRLLPQVLSAADVESFCSSLNECAKRIFEADFSAVMVLNGNNPSLGSLHTLSDDNRFSVSHGRSTVDLIDSLVPPNGDLWTAGPDGGYARIAGPLYGRGPSKETLLGVVELRRRRRRRGSKTASEAAASSSRSFCQMLEMVSPTLESLLERERMQLEMARSEVFLELARAVFKDHSHLEPTIYTILCNFLSLVDCDRCQILRCDPAVPTVFKNVFDLTKEAAEVGAGECSHNALPLNSLVASEVALTGKKVNLAFLDDGDRRHDERMGDRWEEMEDSKFKSFLCMAIRDPDGKVLGVISLIDKEGEAGFTENDERFVEAFSIFCGMAMRNAAEYESAVVSEAKLQVAFEVMNYQASATEAEVASLVNQEDDIPAAHTCRIDSFDFNYLELNDLDTIKATIRMFVDLGMLKAFEIRFDTLCRWLLTVKRNYRNETVKYHNWHHAFNVAQMMFCMLLKSNWHKNSTFQPHEVLGIMIACICHDLDHRGTSNSFEVKMNNPLARLYSTSTLERHHLNHCLLLLNIKGNGILDNLCQEHYSNVLDVIERCILATDLELHFRDRRDMEDLASRVSLLHRGTTTTASSGPVVEVQRERELLQSSMMTAADLGAVTKPWVVHRHVSQLIAEEFWQQGDIERNELHLEPPPMLDRRANLSKVQIGFIDNVCADLYQAMCLFHDSFRPMLDGCLQNRSRWEGGGGGGLGCGSSSTVSTPPSSP